MKTTNSYKRSLVRLVPLALVAATAACGSNGASANGPPSTITPRLQLVDRTTHALSTGAMQWVNGTYTGCTNPNGAANMTTRTVWSARISGVAAMTNAPLIVTKNDTACTLAITSIVADAAYAGATPIAIGTGYGTASSFSTGMGPISFYANAKADALTFAADFSLTILFSDNLADVTPSTTATYASVMSPDNATLQVPSPDYSVGFGSFALQTDVGQFVQTATGSVAINRGSNPGESYIINTDQTLGSTFAAIDTAFLAGGTPVAIPAAPTAITPIAASAFTLTGGSVQLPAVRNVIIVHTVSGVSSYEVMRITFNAAG